MCTGDMGRRDSVQVPKVGELGWVYLWRIKLIFKPHPTKKKSINCTLKVRSGIFYSRKSMVINKFCNKLCSTFCLKWQFCFTLFLFLEQYYIYEKFDNIFYGRLVLIFILTITHVIFFFLHITNNLTHLQMSNLCWFIYMTCLIVCLKEKCYVHNNFIIFSQ